MQYEFRVVRVDHNAGAHKQRGPTVMCPCGFQAQVVDANGVRRVNDCGAVLEGIGV